VGQTPGEIRRDIEQTRVRMGANIEAIGYRMDVPARMRYRFSHIVHDVSGALGGKSNGHNGGDGDLIAAGEEKVSSLLQSAQSALTGMAGVVEERVSDAGQAVRSGLSEAKKTVGETTAKATGSASSETEDASGWAQDAEPGQAQARMQDRMHKMRDTAMNNWRRLGGFAKDNAPALGLGAFAVGVAAGMLIPRRRGRISALRRFWER
jgi:hypothetical protein